MQNLKSLNKIYFFKCCFITLFSILLYGCNSNYLEINTKDNEDDSNVGNPEISSQQINIDELLEVKEPFVLTNLTPIKKIAVLLPMTGRYSKIGKAIYDGIEVQLNEFKDELKPSITIFDTGDEDIIIKNIYREIMDDDFDFIIGPLKKNLIDEIIKYEKNAVPILTLNYSNKLRKLSKNIYQFGLLPEDESICIAEKSIIDGNKNTALLYPDNLWGKRIAKSFALRFEELGGKIIDETIYQKDSKSINSSVKNLLKIQDSIKRKNKIQNILNVKLQFKPHIANDLDSIFAVGTSKNMRALKPQFNFNFAEDIPFYSTSHIYNGIINKEKNEDLNDIKFCDIPWLYNEKNIIDKKSFLENTKKKDLLRFIALGMDSIKVIRNIDKLELNKNKFLPGDTGYLQLDEFNKIRRDLVIVKFKNGKAKKIPF
tara:strand:- start:4122 stop:5405 length:1284 start_codon:yes stop_codon:yes gene_type:complete